MYYKYLALVYTPLLAPLQANPVLVSRIRNKYPQKILKHIDRVFWRTIDPETGEIKPTLMGNTVRGAINRRLRENGLQTPKKLRIDGMYCEENDVSVYIMKIVNTKGEETVATIEAVIPPANCKILSRDRLPEEIIVHDIKSPSELQRKTLTIGWMRTKGYGRTAILGWRK